jgi:hypothetical protein
LNRADDLEFSNIDFDNETHFAEGAIDGFASLTFDVPLVDRDPNVCVIWRRNNDTQLRENGVLSVGLSLIFEELVPYDKVSVL